MPRRVYVSVRCDFADDGTMLPRKIVWEDGSVYGIDRVKQITQAAARKSGGQGDRYTVVIGGKETYLFFQRNASLSGNNIGRWFVEKKES